MIYCGSLDLSHMISKFPNLVNFQKIYCVNEPPLGFNIEELFLRFYELRFWCIIFGNCEISFCFVILSVIIIHLNSKYLRNLRNSSYSFSGACMHILLMSIFYDSISMSFFNIVLKILFIIKFYAFY